MELYSILNINKNPQVFMVDGLEKEIITNQELFIETDLSNWRVSKGTKLILFEYFDVEGDKFEQAYTYDGDYLGEVKDIDTFFRDGIEPCITI